MVRPEAALPSWMQVCGADVARSCVDKACITISGSVEADPHELYVASWSVPLSVSSDCSLWMDGWCVCV